VKLHDPIKAIDLLNKMDKIYSEGPQSNTDNRNAGLTFVVGKGYAEETKEPTERVIRGERTGKATT